jgi:hypothetical protein
MYVSADAENSALQTLSHMHTRTASRSNAVARQPDFAIKGVGLFSDGFIQFDCNALSNQ